MAGDVDKNFLRLAVEENLITKGQLGECMELQKKTGKPLAFIMLQKGYLTDEMLSLIARAEEKPPPREEGEDRQKGEDRIFMKLALLKRFATREQLDECMQTQRRFQDARYFIPLKTLVVKRGYMGREQVLEILELKKNVLYCPFCEKQYVSQKGVQSGELRHCKECGGTLTPAFLDEHRRESHDEETRRRRQEISRRMWKGEGR